MLNGMYFVQGLAASVDNNRFMQNGLFFFNSFSIEAVKQGHCWKRPAVHLLRYLIISGFSIRSLKHRNERDLEDYVV